MDIINLNVGGTLYTTSRLTLTKFPDTMLTAMFAGDMIPSVLDKDGNYFIDRDGKIFAFILNFLRTGQLLLPERFDSMDSLKHEAEYFQIKPLIRALKTNFGEFETIRRGTENVVLILKGKLSVLKHLPNDMLLKAQVLEKYNVYTGYDNVTDYWVKFSRSYQRSYLRGEKIDTDNGFIYTDPLPTVDNINDTANDGIEDEAEDIRPYMEEAWRATEFEGEPPKETDVVELKYKGIDMAMEVEKRFIAKGYDLIRINTSGSAEEGSLEIIQLWTLLEY